MWTSAIQSPGRFQWETSSNPSQSTNCGPTCATKITDFYRDGRFGIETTRRLVTDCCHPTTYQQQAYMLTRRGIPASLVNVTSLRQLTSLLAGGRRPVILALHMSRVPAAVRGHSFTGWHAVVCMARASGGYWINDPNFSPPGGLRPDPTGGKRFYSDTVMQSAFINNDQHWAIAPNSAKYIPPPPPPAPKPLPAAQAVADGDPNPMRFRRATANNDRFEVHTIRAGKPVRKGALISSGTWTTVPSDAAFYSFGRIPKADLPTSEQQYGDVLLGVWYSVNGDHIGYVKAVDLR